jgi:hypothetical protein
VTNVNQLGGKKKKQPAKNSLLFEKAGTLIANYGYSFGDHLWEFKIHYQQPADTSQQQPFQLGNHSPGQNTQAPATPDMTGIMVVGVINRRFSTSKLIGAVVNYSL